MALIVRELLFVPLHISLVVPEGEHIQKLIETKGSHASDITHPPLVARGELEATPVTARTIGPTPARSALCRESGDRLAR